MKFPFEYICKSEADTQKLAESFVRLLEPGDVILLKGDLGSGKTFLVKEICRCLASEDEATSPSFAIIHQYQGPVAINHLDLYRIKDIRELDELGWEELLRPPYISFVEWPELIENLLPSYYQVSIQMDGSQRIFTIDRKGKKL